MIDDDECALRLSMALLLHKKTLKQLQAATPSFKIEFAMSRAGLNAKQLTRALGRQTEIIVELSRLLPGEASDES